MVDSVEWIWLRHAPVRGHDQRYYGRLDVPAEPVDPVQAKRLAATLPEGAVWLTTPLSRTGATARALKSDVQPIPVEDLAEQDFGDWQGRTYADVFAANPGLDWTDPAHLEPPGGESFAGMCGRVGDAIERLSAHYAGNLLVAVAHAGTIRAALAHALGLAPEVALRFEVAPLSLTRLRWTGGHWIVAGVNWEIV